ncbi:uncharacterized protein LOC133488212 [Phyllopteryx taeniolatus]|uniref:uncharacterized protein LOC133488212 n=1 Tax=Phyllopteryx taeniolatus TaxID=161469 RepID=UPI002AD3F2C0|nr:uncharacterized protein LOC133488212 [Phyllopteryx taeniolatus]XP_061651819.1 uncharacterized protein LOC133488212 [Phyllopteryx taeniolatus]XP_061651820.1 uncharacterized protein LOC133488212 [Phyllopteryx taeniolatus]XP_061651821.1 uncharacterized protein LOC133488212 [Phyllopteryx taeniolatus]
MTEPRAEEKIECKEPTNQIEREPGGKMEGWNFQTTDTPHYDTPNPHYDTPKPHYDTPQPRTLKDPLSQHQEVGQPVHTYRNLERAVEQKENMYEVPTGRESEETQYEQPDQDIGWDSFSQDAIPRYSTPRVFWLKNRRRIKRIGFLACGCIIMYALLMLLTNLNTRVEIIRNNQVQMVEKWKQNNRSDSGTGQDPTDGCNKSPQNSSEPLGIGKGGKDINAWLRNCTTYPEKSKKVCSTHVVQQARWTRESPTIRLAVLCLEQSESRVVRKNWLQIGHSEPMWYTNEHCAGLPDGSGGYWIPKAANKDIISKAAPLNHTCTTMRPRWEPCWSCLTFTCANRPSMGDDSQKSLTFGPSTVTPPPYKNRSEITTPKALSRKRRSTEDKFKECQQKLTKETPSLHPCLWNTGRKCNKPYHFHVLTYKDIDIQNNYVAPGITSLFFQPKGSLPYLGPEVDHEPWLNDSYTWIRPVRSSRWISEKEKSLYS